MAVRPSHRPHRDQSSYITLKWHRLSLSWAALTGSRKVLWAAVTLSPSPCDLSVPQQCAERAEHQTVVQRFV